MRIECKIISENQLGNKISVENIENHIVMWRLKRIELNIKTTFF